MAFEETKIRSTLLLTQEVRVAPRKYTVISLAQETLLSPNDTLTFSVSIETLIFKGIGKKYRPIWEGSPRNTNIIRYFLCIDWEQRSRLVSMRFHCFHEIKLSLSSSVDPIITNIGINQLFNHCQLKCSLFGHYNSEMSALCATVVLCICRGPLHNIFGNLISTIILSYPDRVLARNHLLPLQLCTLSIASLIS